LATAVPAVTQSTTAKSPAVPLADLKVVTKEDFVPGQQGKAAMAPAQSIPTGQVGSAVVPTPVKNVTDEGSVWDRMADEAAIASGIVLDTDRKSRFRRLAAMYFRDLRDELETVSKLTMTVASGGLGFNDDEAGRVMGFLRERNVAARAAGTARTVEEKANFTAVRVAKVMGETDERDKREQEGLDQLYSRLTEKLVKPHAEHLPVIPVSGQPSRSGGAKGPTGSAAPRIIPVVVERKPVPGGETPSMAARPSSEKAQATSGQAAKSPTAAIGARVAPVVKPIDDTHLLPPAIHELAAPVSKLSPPKPTATVSSNAGSRTAAARPSVTDIIAPPRLVGPIEELRRLAVVDFRRLSRDPREANLKIRDKIDLLADRSFAERDRGVKAWQESAVNRLYLDILRLSLEGKPVPEVIAVREKNGEPTLTKAEFDAIMDLNRKLRFG
jgi:hypothetical protein